MGDSPVFAYVYNNIGAIYSLNENPNEAISYFYKAMNILKNTFLDKNNLDLAHTFGTCRCIFEYWQF